MLRNSLTLALSSLVLFAVPATTLRAQSSPVAVVTQLYEDYAWEAVETRTSRIGLTEESPDVLGKYFDDHLVQLLVRDRECRVRTREVCSLGGSPIWDSNDPQAHNLTVAATNDSTLVAVSFRRRFPPADGMTTVRLLYRMVETPRGWRVRDIVRADGGSLVGALTSGPMSGTYRLLLCASTCTEADSSNALAVAAIVIADDSLANTDAWKTTLAEIRGRRVMRQASAMDNVCFRIERRRSHVGSEELYFGIDRNGSTRLVRRDGDSLSIRVYQSPDASYVLRWQGTGERITGEGWSSGWTVTQTPHRNAYFIATRTGPPVSDACR